MSFTYSVKIKKSFIYLLIYTVIFTFFCSSDSWNRKLVIIGEGFNQGACIKDMWTSWCEI